MNDVNRHAALASGPSARPPDGAEIDVEVYRAIIDLLSEGVVVQDASGSIIACNPVAERILGVSYDQMMGRTSSDPRWRSIREDGSPFPGEAHPAMIALRTGQPQTNVLMGVHRPEGMLTWLLVDAHPFFQAQSPAPRGVVALFKDITEQVRAKRELREGDERYRTLLDLSPDGIIIADETGRILACNEQFARMHGYDHSAEVIGRNAMEFTTPEEFARFFEEIAAAFTAGEQRVRGVEIEARRRDGTPVIAEYSIARAPWPTSSSGVAYVSLIRDITLRKQMLAELEHHRANLETEVRARTNELQAEMAERAEAQAALQRSQHTLAAAEGIAHLGSWEVDLATNETRASDELKRIFGFDRTARPIAWVDLLNAIHPDERGAVRVAMLHAMESGQVYSVQFRITLPDGRTRVVWAKGEVHREAAGRPTHMHGMAQDITEQEQVRQSLDQRVKELSILQELGHVVSLSFSPEEIVRVYLERLIALAGLDMGRVFLLQGDRLRLAGACSCPAVPCPGMQHRVLAVGECMCGLAVQQGQILYTAEVDDDPCLTPECCHTCGLHSLVALPLRSGQATIGVLTVGATAPHAFADRLAFLEAIADSFAARLQNALLHQETQERAAGLEEAVSERTRELLLERDRTRAILESVGESVVVTDLDGQVLFANPITAALTGYSRDETLGRPIWRHWSEQSLRGAWPNAQEALRRGEAWSGEISGRRQDGAAYTFAVTGTPLQDADVAQGSARAVWAQRDITALKKAELLKDQFVSNVSHELRTPISIIALCCDNLTLFNDRLDEGQRQALIRDIEEQARQLNSIVADTLQITQIDAGRMSTARGRVDLARLAHKEAEALRAFAGKRGQRLRVSAAAPVFVIGNETQLRQIVRNLLDNAAKYTPDGGEISCICETRAVAPRDAPDAVPPEGAARAVVEVADKGIGIAANDLPYVFERFFRVNGESGTPGTGLGLPIAQELASLHGGWITAASIPGQGSTFTVYLPVAGA